jgi:hypothetical protein
MLFHFPHLVAVLKSESRDYAQEYRDYHGKPAQIKERAQRNAARRKLGLKPGDGKEADHKNPISNGGSNSSRNLRAVSRDTNRKKGSKVGKDDDWQESKHPRAANGQFGSGSGSSTGSSGKKPSKTKRKQERRAEEASQGKVTGAIQTLLSGGSALDNVKWFKQPEAKPKAEEKKPESKPASQEKPKEQAPAQAKPTESKPSTQPKQKKPDFSSDPFIREQQERTLYIQDSSAKVLDNLRSGKLKPDDLEKVKRELGHQSFDNTRAMRPMKDGPELDAALAEGKKIDDKIKAIEMALDAYKAEQPSKPIDWSRVRVNPGGASVRDDPIPSAGGRGVLVPPATPGAPKKKPAPGEYGTVEEWEARTGRKWTPNWD